MKNDQSAVEEAIETANEVLDGRVCLLRACRKIVALQSRIQFVPQEILDPVIGVESELDDIPDEARASLWEAEAFQEKMRERDEYLDRVRPVLIESFRKLREHLRGLS